MRFPYLDEVTTGTQNHANASMNSDILTHRTG